SAEGVRLQLPVPGILRSACPARVQSSVLKQRSPELRRKVALERMCGRLWAESQSRARAARCRRCWSSNGSLSQAENGFRWGRWRRECPSKRKIRADQNASLIRYSQAFLATVLRPALV